MENLKKIIITGGAGFIGSSLTKFLINETKHSVLNFDKLTYASNLQSLSSVDQNSRYEFIQADICDREAVSMALREFQPDIIMNLAAESHVDRSINEPADFIKTNVFGTLVLLECAREYYNYKKNNKILFHHISTDEVYGSLNQKDLFTEQSKYDPSSPYSASKACSDHLVRAWNRTYNLPIVITNCSNNYGPYQFPEKFIPVIILNAINGNPLPIYGNGENIRDWLYVDDHVDALYKVVTRGKVGETYNIGGNNEFSNLDVVNIICEILDDLIPINSKDINFLKIQTDTKGTLSYKSLITFVEDRPGHDFRYAIDSKKIQKELNWTPKESFLSGIKKTVEWYLNNFDLYKDFHNSKIKRQGLLKNND